MSEKNIINRLSAVGIAGNCLLAALKLCAGVLGSSAAMISDGVHSLSDIFGTAIAFVGSRMSLKEADKKHPYGHDRFACVAAIALGMILLLTGFKIGSSGIQHILFGSYEDSERPTLLALAVAGIAVLSKEFLFRYVRHYAKKINSAAFMADAWHHRSDAVASAGAMLGIGGAMLGVPVLESIACVGICCCILKAALDILKDALDKMLDTACDEDFEKAISEYICNAYGVSSLKMLRTRRFGNKVYADAEICVSSSMNIETVHTLVSNLQSAIEAQYPEIKSIMIYSGPTTAPIEDTPE